MTRRTWTTFTTQTRLTGRVTRIRRTERKVKTWANTPGPSSQAVSYPAGWIFFVNKKFSKTKWFSSINELIFLCYSFLLQFKYCDVEAAIFTSWGALERSMKPAPSPHLLVSLLRLLRAGKWTDNLGNENFLSSLNFD